MTPASNTTDAEFSLWGALREKARPLRFRAALMGTALGGFVVAFEDLTREPPGLGLPAGVNFSLIAFASLGGFIGGWLSAGWIGREGLGGFALSLAGCLLASALGGAVAGTLIIPLLGTLVGTVWGVQLAFQAPLVALVWLTCAVVLHFWIGVARRAKGSR